MTLKKKRAKEARRFRKLGLSWGASHKIAKAFVNQNVSSWDLKNLIISTFNLKFDHSDIYYCYSCDRDHWTAHYIDPQGREWIEDCGEWTCPS